MLMNNKIYKYKNPFQFNFSITTEEKYKVQLEYITKGSILGRERFHEK